MLTRARSPHPTWGHASGGFGSSDRVCGGSEVLTGYRAPGLSQAQDPASGSLGACSSRGSSAPGLWVCKRQGHGGTLSWAGREPRGLALPLACSLGPSAPPGLLCLPAGCVGVGLVSQAQSQVFWGGGLLPFLCGRLLPVPPSSPSLPPLPGEPWPPVSPPTAHLPCLLLAPWV